MGQKPTSEDVSNNDATMLAALSDFDDAAAAVIGSKGSINTKSAYIRDLAAWLLFCGENHLNPWSVGISYAKKFRGIQCTRLSTGSVRRRLATLSSI